MSDAVYYTAAAVVGGHNDRFGKARRAIIKTVPKTLGSGLVDQAIEDSSVFEIEKSSLARAELKAVVLCAESAPAKCTICTFSEYVYSGATKWIGGWATNGWRNKKGEEIKNKDLWGRLLSASSSRKIQWYLDQKAAPLDGYSKMALAMATGGRVDLESKPTEESEEPTFVVNEVVREIPMSYGGW